MNRVLLCTYLLCSSYVASSENWGIFGNLHFILSKSLSINLNESSEIAELQIFRTLESSAGSSTGIGGGAGEESDMHSIPVLPQNPLSRMTNTVIWDVNYSLTPFSEVSRSHILEGGRTCLIHTNWPHGSGETVFQESTIWGFIPLSLGISFFFI